MVSPAKIPGWYKLLRENAECLLGVPGWCIDRDGKCLIHRSHLPLLDPVLTQSLGQSIEADSLQRQFGNLTLRPYQLPGRAFIRGREGTLLAWQMRTGKSFVTIASHDLVDGPLLIMAPLSTRAVWLRACKERWPHVPVTVLTGRTYDEKKVYGKPILFVHYDIAQSWQAPAIKPGMLVIDECHLLASSNQTWRTQAAKLYATQSKRIVLLTGTPIWNKPKGLYTLLQMIGGGAFGTYFQYIVRYCAARKGPYGIVADGTSHEEELKQRLTEVAQVLHWQDVVEDLPPIERTVETVNLDADARLDLTKLGEALRSSGLRPNASNVGEIAHARRVLGHAKWMTATQIAERYLVGEESVVIWTWHKEIAGKIYEYLRFSYNAYIVTGDVNANSRDRILEEWRMSTPSVLIITLAVGQVGIDLSHARHTIFAEQDWTPAVVSQAEYRTFSPTRPMTVTHVVADHPVDVRIVSALIKKCRLAGAVGLSASETEMELLSNAIDNDTLDITLSSLLECNLEGEDDAGY